MWKSTIKIISWILESRIYLWYSFISSSKSENIFYLVHPKTLKWNKTCFNCSLMIYGDFVDNSWWQSILWPESIIKIVPLRTPKHYCLELNQAYQGHLLTSGTFAGKYSLFSVQFMCIPLIVIFVLREYEYFWG